MKVTLNDLPYEDKKLVFEAAVAIYVAWIAANTLDDPQDDMKLAVACALKLYEEVFQT